MAEDQLALLNTEANIRTDYAVWKGTIWVEHGLSSIVPLFIGECPASNIEIERFRQRMTLRQTGIHLLRRFLCPVTTQAELQYVPPLPPYQWHHYWAEEEVDQMNYFANLRAQVLSLLRVKVLCRAARSFVDEVRADPERMALFPWKQVAVTLQQLGRVGNQGTGASLLGTVSSWGTASGAGYSGTA